MALLPYIDDEELYTFTKEVLDKVLLAYTNADQNIYSNVVDPFSATFDLMRQGITIEEWFNQERSRQVQKTLQNAVGNFHQNILGSIKGWHNPGRGGGYDLINTEKKIIAEVKNKHNTLNAVGGAGTYTKLTRYLDGDFTNYLAYVVFIVPKNPKDYESNWSPSIADGLMPLRDDLKKIDGESFYRLVTGYDDALVKLFDILPQIISKILITSPLAASEKFMLNELFTKAFI